MSFLSRLLGTGPDPRADLLPLWHRVVELSRTPAFYAQHHVADTVDGRFDMVTTLLAITMLRMEQSPALAARCSLLTELFVEDMDGQLRESGLGDVVVGKHMGKLMSALGGRLGALRDALASADPAAAVAQAVKRNTHWREEGAGDAAGLAAWLLAFRQTLADTPDDELAAGRIDV
ncbi:MAG: ubiquinol-cytochrome C chaperone family protein [Alteraurantiacibacter sp.]